MKQLMRLAAVALLVSVAMAGLNGVSQPRRAQAEPLNGVVLPVNLCTALAFGFFDAIPLACQFPMSNMDKNMVSFAAVVGADKDTNPEAVDFKVLDLDRNQLHELDGKFIVIVFVDRQMPTQIEVENGLIRDRDGNLRGHNWICGSDGGTTFGDDPDCLVGNTDSGKNGAVVFEVVPDPKGKRGPGRITVVQERVPFDIAFTVVGEARDIQFTNLETNLEVGADGGTADPEAASPLNTRTKVTATTTDDCALPGGASGFFDANATAQRTVTLVRALDSDGTAITGAFIRWKSDAPDIGTTATGLTPTIDLGTFGLGAPNIACGTAIPGTFHLEALTLQTQKSDGTGALVDTESLRMSRTSTFTVAGAPTQIALTAAPAEMACDGKSTVTVSANVVDENGDPAADGQIVDFDVVALGTANPLHAKVKGGIATSVITPLASAETSVTVNVTASANEGKFFDLKTAKNSIRIDCNKVPGTGTAAGPGGAAAGADGASAGGRAGVIQPTGSIHGPDTGSGPRAIAREIDGFAAWSLICLALGGAALASARFAIRRT
jgi:hypothetical protein